MTASKHEEKKEEFALLRANGLILADIASQLNISQRTAERWNKNEDIRKKIDAIKKRHLKELQEVCDLSSEERKKRLTQSILMIDEALEKKNLKTVSGVELLSLKLRFIRALREEDTKGW